MVLSSPWVLPIPFHCHNHIILICGTLKTSLKIDNCYIPSFFNLNCWYDKIDASIMVVKPPLLVTYNLCFCPSVHALALIDPPLFWVRNIREDVTWDFSFCVSWVASIGVNAWMRCNCSSSFFVVVSFSPPKTCGPFFKESWVLTYSGIQVVLSSYLISSGWLNSSLLLVTMVWM